MTSINESILTPIVRSITTDYSFLPRSFVEWSDIRTGLYGTAEGPDARAYAKVKILIESYVFLRLKGIVAAAAYLAVFRDGLTGEADRAAQLASYLEETIEYQSAYMKALREATPAELMGGQVERLHMLDRAAKTMRTEKGREECAKARGKILKFIEVRTTQQEQPKE